MPSSENSLQHESYGAQGEDLERHPSAAPLKLIAIPLHNEEGIGSKSFGSSQALRAGGSHHLDDKEAHLHHTQPSIYKRRTEANSTELFFDLFFVANLTVFSSRHEVNDGQTLRAYILFFTILWFTWLQVTLFDARFSADSLFERTCKSLHFGVMIGFAIVGPKTAGSDTPYDVLQQLTLILLASRVILIVQYTTVLTFTRKKAEALLPLVLQAITLVLSAAMFIGIYFSFNDANGTKGQIGWIVVSVAEALSLFAISSCWTSFSFRYSCLPQRVGLLTLIILGEGIIGFAETLTKIADTISSTSILSGVAISSVLITYFLFLLYFDQIDIDRFGTIRQHIWAIVHYPLHLAALLTLEGVNQLALFSVAFKQVKLVAQPINDLANSNVDISNNTLASTINATVDQFSFSSGSAVGFQAPIPESINSTLADLVAGNVTDEQLETLSDAITTYVFQTYGYEVESYDAEGVQGIYDTISTAYLYFFIAAGAALLTLAVLLWLGKRHKTAAEYSSIVVRVAIGSALCLITLSYLPSQQVNAENFVESGWTLPVVMLSLGFVLLLDVLAVVVFRGKLAHEMFRRS